MPEGHHLHFLADQLTRAFAGAPVRVSSPTARFEAEAAQLDGQPVERAEAWGKQLFVEFPGERYIHVHLGLIGKLDVVDNIGQAPVGQVRLRIWNDHRLADLRGATACDLWSRAQVEGCIAKLGPDPLRPDDDPTRAWTRIHQSAKPIGALLMDQAVVAGIGNVYRAELLFRHRIDPMRPGNTLRRSQWDAMWADLVILMQDGFAKNRIDTVRDEHMPEAMGRDPRVDDHGGEVYVYRRAQMPCHVCGTTVRIADLEGRNLFWCPKCQPRFRSRAARV